jgi:signal transduction histidine kinase
MVRGTRLSVLLGMLYALLVGLPFVNLVPMPVLLGWAGALVVVRVLRLWVASRWRGGAQDAQSLLAWSRWIMFVGFLQALLWGLGSWWLVAPDDPVAEAALHLGLAIVVLGNVPHVAAAYPVLQVYTLGVTVPLFLRDLWIGDMHLVLAAMAAALGACALFSGYRHASADRETQRQKQRNAELIGELQREVQARTEAQARAEQAHADKADFLAAAGHDLRQPLNAIGLLAEALPREPSPAEVALVAGRIYACVQQMGDIVHGLLDLSRLDAGTVMPVSASFDVAPLLREVGEQHADSARAKGLQLEVQAESLHAYTDAGLLRRVLSNLVSNAVRYTPHGQVRLLARRQGETLHLCVSDTGVGIAPDELEQVFKPFYQAHNPGRDHRQGHGLGLAIVQRLTRLLGIELCVQSAPGQGSRFELTLPIAIAAPAPALPTDAAGPDDDVLHGRRVLVVEDDPASAQALALLLGRWGCHVRCAGSTVEALNQLTPQWRPEFVVADLRLSDGDDGHQTTLALRERMAIALPAVMMTGESSHQRAMDARHAGFTVLNKPLRPAQLRAFMNEAFRAR